MEELVVLRAYTEELIKKRSAPSTVHPKHIQRLYFVTLHLPLNIYILYSKICGARGIRLAVLVEIDCPEVCRIKAALGAAPEACGAESLHSVDRAHAATIIIELVLGNT
jgi:hypothetical protein